MRKMRHKNWKTYLKIACSWLLIFSICFMNLETVSASEDETSVVTEQEETQDTEAFTSETDAQQTETEKRERGEHLCSLLIQRIMQSGLSVIWQ